MAERFSVDVKLSSKVMKQLRKTPTHIGVKLLAWVKLVGTKGINHAQTQKGYHDEPLKGSKKGRRSIRLSKK